MLLLLPRQVGGKLNNLGTGQCTVPETPIALRVRRVGVVTTENGTSVSPRVVNRTQAHRFRVVIARKWPRARSSSLIFDHPLRSFRAICCPRPAARAPPRTARRRVSYSVAAAVPQHMRVDWERHFRPL